MRDTDGRIKRCRPIPQDEINLNEPKSVIRKSGFHFA